MTSLLFTLLADGPSDRALLHAIEWLLRQHSTRPFQRQWADLSVLRRPPRSLAERLRVALELYPCDILFVHRDAEGACREARMRELGPELAALGEQAAVCVIPVRMQEAWLIFDEAALRLAAGNPNGTMPLDLPRLDRLEGVPDPKALLNQLLLTASGLRTGRRRKWRPSAHILTPGGADRRLFASAPASRLPRSGGGPAPGLDGPRLAVTDRGADPPCA